MAIPTLMNGQITDSVTQGNLSVLGAAPAMAMGSIYQSMAHAKGILYQNSVSAQMQGAIAGQAATNLGVIQMYNVNTTAAATASARIGQSDTTQTLLTMLVILAALRRF